MSSLRQFDIRPTERFPQLAHAPIVEAVIHWRGRCQPGIAEGALRDHLQAALPDYPASRRLQQLHGKLDLGPDAVAHPPTAQWLGLRLDSRDGRYIAQFTRDGFVFSRLAPYENWSRFAGEALRLWRVHAEALGVREIERLGVRFINRIAPAAPFDLAGVLRMPPAAPQALSLPIEDFLHRDTFCVPHTPYRVSIIQASQPPTPADGRPGLIVDVDAFAAGAMDVEEATIREHLENLRWLKNKAFYALLTDEAVERFQESPA